ncbi:MAG: prolipoprotein diacylglyceryl transferase [Endomicrobiaceae bacterium]|nr:prolipoprotein diacylglyceryl transferase [Endomicrobiaceae bacterium]
MQIVWNIEPVIIKILSFELRYYSLLFATGFIVAYLLFIKINESASTKIKYPRQQIDNLVIFIIIGAVAGARLGHCLFYDFAYYSKHIFEIFLPFSFDKNGNFIFTGYQGLASHGGAVGVFIVILIFCKKYKQNIVVLLDKICIVVPLAGGFIRLGNLMNSEIIGKPTNSDFGFIFQKIDHVARHPAQLYEAICYFIIFFILSAVYKKTTFADIKGKIFGLFLILVFSCRFLIEFVKENQSVFENNMILNMGQILSLPFLVIGFILFFYNQKKL